MNPQEVTFPGNGSGSVQGDDGPEHAAPEEKHQQRKQQRADSFFEDAGEKQVAEVGEDYAAGAGVDGVAAARSSQVPRPEASAPRIETTQKLSSFRRISRPPSMMIPSELLVMWDQDMWRKGAQNIPARPRAVRGTTPCCTRVP